MSEIISKASILLTVYTKSNGAYLDECFNSIYNQTYLPNEILLIQEGEISSETRDVIEKWKLKFKNIFTHKIIDFQNGPMGFGLPSSLNYGIKEAKFDYIIRMDTDDICDKSRIEKQLKFADNNPEIDLFGSHIIEFDEDLKFETGSRKVPLTQRSIVKSSKFKNPFNGPAVVFKKQVALELGGYPIVASNEDYCFWALFIINNKKLQNLDEYLVNMRGGDGIIDRRSSKRYRKGELMSLMYLRKIGFFNSYEYYAHVFFKTIFRNMPFIFIKQFYNKLLR
jgi:glycosyltransferase involved in cell wall biosynthesis